jgi:hypothetical protein
MQQHTAPIGWCSSIDCFSVQLSLRWHVLRIQVCWELQILRELQAGGCGALLDWSSECASSCSGWQKSRVANLGTWPLNMRSLTIKDTRNPQVGSRFVVGQYAAVGVHGDGTSRWQCFWQYGLQCGGTVKVPILKQLCQPQCSGMKYYISS